MKVIKNKNYLKYSTIIFIVFLLFFTDTKPANAGFFSDGFKNAISIVKSIISPNNNFNNNSVSNDPQNSQNLSDNQENQEQEPQLPTPWSDLLNLANLIKKEQLQLQEEFLPQQFINQQDKDIETAELINAFIKLDLNNTTSAIILFNISQKDLEEWQIRQNIIILLDKEISWYDQKLKDGLKINNRVKVDNLIIVIKNHRKIFRKESVEPLRMTLLINGADNAISIAQNRSLIIKNSVNQTENNSAKKIAKRIYSSAQDKINLASSKLQFIQKNKYSLSPDEIESSILEINSLIKSAYEDFQSISELIE